ncbi:hypothetical protein BaRGS_00034538 [Batillaria attramentaria]|uniref:Uncharacterized protein n=1 Tax=Batillaria attramentaria TaxID=370345 RepID=A0ABD0JGS5_9CAEN
MRNKSTLRVCTRAPERQRTTTRMKVTEDVWTRSASEDASDPWRVPDAVLQRPSGHTATDVPALLALSCRTLLPSPTPGSAVIRYDS